MTEIVDSKASENFATSMKAYMHQEQPLDDRKESNTPAAVIALERDEEMADDDVDENDDCVLDLRNRGLEKLSRAAPEWQLNTITLLLDGNNLQRLDNIHTFQCLEKLSVQGNRLLRMFQVSKLSHLKILNLAHNSVVSMEGLKELKLLTWLSLASNGIKGIEQLHQNVHLEHLDLSDNAITAVTDISHLRNLRTLLLHQNRLSSLRQCDKFLPAGSMTTLTLNDNQLSDLTELSHLSGLRCLEQLTLANNPALRQPEDIRRQFDYRPYVINWCLSLRMLDGLSVGAKESLKAEWMYSQSKGRHFSSGQQADLLEYLVQSCPLHPDEDWQEDKKLNLILCKVQEHQQSLRHESGFSSSLPRSSSTERPVPAPAPPPQYPGTPQRQQRSQQGRRNSSPRSLSSTPTLSRRPATASLTRNVRASRTSPSPVRRTAPQQPASYRVALPRSLYGDDGADVNGNGEGLMTQSMIVGAARQVVNVTTSTRTPEQLMTASCDPSMLSLDQSAREQKMSKKSIPAWSGRSSSTAMHRPNSLFSDEEVQDGGLYLQDLSDGELSQSKLQGRLQPRLNPVPESLNSPDIPAPSLTHNGRPRRDDPLQFHRGTEMSMSTYSANKKTRRDQEAMSRSVHLPATGRGHNGYSSSSDLEINKKRGSNEMCKSTSRKLPNKQVSDLKKSQDVGGSRRRQQQRHMSTTADDESSQSESSEADTAAVRVRRRQSPAKGNRSKITSQENTPKKQVSKGGGGGSLPRSHSARLSGDVKSAKSMMTTSAYAPERYSSARQPPRKARPGSAPIRSLPTGGNSVSRPLPASSSKMTESASTTIQKHWRGHHTRQRDDRVHELKQEVRTLRSEEHIKHLTKELQSAKQALEQERKLRSLQMDAIKVLWKEVQMMDAVKNSDLDRPRPSGSFGSKISSRSSEHSIAKLMETLEATAGSGKAPKDEERRNSEEKDSATDKLVTSEAALQKLNETCNSLQAQVEQLQNSLTGVVRFMSSFTTAEGPRSRHSSSTSTTQDTASFQFHAFSQSMHGGMMTSMQQQNMFTSLDPVAMAALQRQQPRQHKDPPTSLPVDTLSMTRSCDSLVQTEITAVLTPKAEESNSGGGPHPFLHLKAVDVLFQEPEKSPNVTHSPRPSTLPGLNEVPSKSRHPGAVPGLAFLAGKAVMESPQAPKEVKAYAKDLVEGLLSEVKNAAEEQQVDDNATDVSLSLAQDTSLATNAEEEETPTVHTTHEDVSHCSCYVDTDSLEENSPRKVDTKKK